MVYAHTALAKVFDMAEEGSDAQEVARDGLVAVNRALFFAHELRTDK
jgi:hypothetical protein